MLGLIGTKLQIDGKKRDLALFNLAIDSKLRGCDVVAVRVDNGAPSGYAGRPVRFELTRVRCAISALGVDDGDRDRREDRHLTRYPNKQSWSATASASPIMGVQWPLLGLSVVAESRSIHGRVSSAAPDAQSHEAG